MDCIPCLKKSDATTVIPEANDHVQADEDEDVAAERARVNAADQHHLSASSKQPVVQVKNLRKEFQRNQKKNDCTCCRKQEFNEKIRVAVQNSSFLVEAGEVMGLLGPNGAGKTTTLNMIIAEVAPSNGKVAIAGHDIRSSLSEAFQAMGYCPQHDALWDMLLLRDHLECYCAVSGLPPHTIQPTIDFFLDSLNIKEHADKKAKELSGGTKRKLSYILSMLGDPRAVLLDEPSTGMDPKSKRFLWDTISEAFHNERRGAVLTTHYMEEADALCTRVAIMVNGSIECIGSTQHLKNRFGGGYLLEVKLRPAVTESEQEEAISALHRYVDATFPGAVHQQVFQDRVMYRIPQTTVASLAKTFQKLEEAKSQMSLEEYSFSQATLEQVFLEFAKHQMDENEDDNEKGAQSQRSNSARRVRSLHKQLSQNGQYSQAF